MARFLEILKKGSDRTHELHPVWLGRVHDHQLQLLHHRDRTRPDVGGSSAKCESSEGSKDKAREHVHATAIAVFHSSVADDAKGGS